MAFKKSPEDPEHIRNLIHKTNYIIGDDVLVFGASNEYLVEELLKYNKNITIIDIRQESLNRFIKKYPSIKLKLVDKGRDFDGFVSKFSSVIFYDTLHHIRNKRKKIKECYSALKSNGSVILYEPNVYSKLAGEHDQFGKLKDSIYKYSLYRILKDNNFKVRLLSSEELLSRKRHLKKFIISMQKSLFDPRYRILMIAKKR